MEKNGPPNVPRKKVRISIGIINLFAYSVLKNIEIFIESGGFSNSTKLIYQTTSNVWAVMQKNGPPNVPRKKVRISIGIINLFAYSVLKNIEIFIESGVFSNSTKLIYQTTSNVWVVRQK